MLLIGTEVDTSQPFTIDKQVTLFATGLQGADKVVIEVVSMNRSGPGGDFCCPGSVTLPEVQSAVPLKLCFSCTDTAVELTATKPWVVLDMPQKVPLRARKIVDADAVVEVELHETDSRGAGCI